MAILKDVLDRAEISLDGVLDAQIDVPILTAAQRQGDVVWVPRPNKAAATTPVPQSGVIIVRAETNSQNTHSILPWDGEVYFDADERGGESGLVLGVLTVPEGASAFVAHSEEHGANGVGTGTYEFRRQREFAGEWRRVAD
jgi:uncharacterized RmlC-like cupin family protein